MLKFGKKKGDKAPKDGATDLAVAHGAEAGAEGEDAAPKKKGVPKLFLIIGAAALVVVGGGGAAAFVLMKPKPAEAEGAAGHGEEKADDAHGKAEKKEEGGGHGGGGDAEADPALGKIAEGPDGVTFYTVPDMVVNIQSADGRPTFLKLTLTLEMRDRDLAVRLQGEAPRMQDMFQGFLRELRPEDLAGSAGAYQLRAEILRRVNLIAAPGEVDAVLIEEMLVQ